MSITKTRIELHGSQAASAGARQGVTSSVCVSLPLSCPLEAQKALTETEKPFETLPVNVCGEFGSKGLTPVDQL